MSLLTWSPLREFEDIFNIYGRSLDNAAARADSGGRKTQWRPAADISETDKDYVIRLALPGVSREDVDVRVHESVITIKGERQVNKIDDTERQHRVESAYGSFERQFNLPENIDESNIRATSKDGVLQVFVPKQEVAKPQAIEITVN